MRRGWKHWGAAAIVAVAVMTSGALVTPAGAQSSTAPGVTAKDIEIGAVLAKTNATGIDYQDVVDGAQAYFDIVNKGGGVGGRKLKFVKVLDDQSRSSKNILAARSLVEEEKVFAVFQASQDFSGVDVYKKAGTPVFGYNIQEEWSNSPNLFGTYGSYLCLLECPQYTGAFVANQEDFKKPAIFAYGSSPQSAECANGAKRAYDKWGPEVAVFDTSLAFGFSPNDISAAVQAIKDEGVDFVSTCTDLNALLKIRDAVEAAGIQGVSYLAPQGYDAKTMKELGEEIDGMYFLAQFTPFEATKNNEGMQQFLKAMKKAGESPNENLLVGWSGAALLTEGLKAAGKNPTQAAVIDAINQMTDWRANGAIRPVDWTSAHGPAKPGAKTCAAFVQARDGKFVPIYGDGDKPLICIGANPYPASLDDYTNINSGAIE